MLTLCFVGFVAASALVALINWRIGVALAIVIGLLQDPIRKMTPGTPPIYVLSSLPVWALVWLGVFGQESGAWARFRRADPRRARMMWIFGISLVPGTLVTLSYGLSAAPVAALGLFAYVAPLLTLVAGFAFPRKPRDVERVIALYAILSSLFLAGNFLEYVNLAPGWLAVGTGALGGEWIRYPVSGGTIRLISGFFRSPDLAAWHAAALVMIAFTLSLGRRGFQTRSWLLLAAWGGACLLVAGRRKGIVMPFVWASFMSAVFLRTQRAGFFVRFAFVSVISGIALYYASGEFGIGSEYYGYAQSAVSAAPERLVESSWDSVWITFLQSGPLGSGIGSATQGSQHLGIRVAETWQESGPSKLMVELGIPGLLGATALVMAIVRSALAASRGTLTRATVVPLQIGLFAFCAANAVCFTVSHQIYSDLTVLNLSAFFLGAAFSTLGISPALNARPQGRLPVPLWERGHAAVPREAR